MTAVHALQQLASAVAGEPQAALRRLLTLVCELLAMDAAFVSTLDGAGNRTVRFSVFADGTPGPADLTEPLEDTWCARVVANDGLLVDDARGDAALTALPLTAAFGIVSYAGVPLRDTDGSVLGTLCALGGTPHRSLNPRDREVLADLAGVIGPIVKRLDSPEQWPRPGTGLEGIAVAVEGAHDVERLSRPLLEALGDLTGMASAYLTVVHEDVGVQEIRYARHTRSDFELPEGLLVPWDDTLCKRALEEGRACTTDVPAVWGDSSAAQSLGIHVYISVPVELPDGTLWGTLCAADSAPVPDVEDHLPTMRLFARLISAEVDREAAAQRAELARDTDPLTGCATRRVVQPWLFNELAHLSPDEVVVAALVHVENVQAVNDAHGRAAGDAVLVEVGRRLRSVVRADDLVARHGGDDFLVAARVPRSAALHVARRVRTALELSVQLDGTTMAVRTAVGVALSDGHDGPSLVAAAAEAMRGIKRRR